MQDLMKSMASAASGMSAQSLRLRLTSENVANADVPGYRRKLTSFGEVVDDATGGDTVKAGPVTLSDAPARQEYEPGNPLADPKGMVTYSNVDPLIEFADARQAQRSYDACVSVFDGARKMKQAALDLLKS